MTDRPDELDRLGAELRRATPRPDPAARARALAAAMAAFSAQGSAAPARPRESGPQRAARFLGGMFMRLPTLRQSLYAGASLAVIAVAVVIARDPRVTEPVPDPVLERPEVDGTAPKPVPVPGEAGEDKVAMKDATGPGRANVPVQPEAERRADDTPSTRTESADAPAREAKVAEEAAPATRDRLLAGSDQAGTLAAPPPPSVAPTAGLVAPEPMTSRPQPPVDTDAATVRDDGRDRFEGEKPNPLKVTAEEPVSTFSIDVDTASYSWMRNAIEAGQMPDAEAVRVEELVNYFPYAYPAPESRETPFATTVTVMPTPWNAGTKLMHIGIRGYDLTKEERPDANLVFLIDTSGSMDEPDKLPLLLNAFRLLLGELRPTDQVAIVAYAGSAGVVLEPTPASDKAKILAALGRLSAGGSTAGGEGILAAYALAEAMKAEGEITRVLLATDGDFNVGLSDDDALTKLIEEKRESGVFLSVLGFGEGNYNDALMQRLAQNGNGQAAYIDSLAEARKVLVEGVAGALFPIAKDVKIQVEFNPATVAEYRLIGYETRALAREDFNNDAVDAGEIGAGHTVTAIYEITPVGSTARLTDDLRYSTQTQPTSVEYGFLRLRYKLPDGTESRLIERSVTPADEGTNPETAFAAAVAGFGQLLKGTKYLGDWNFADALALARTGIGADPYGYRADFVKLVREAETLARLNRP
jgi:Ca-activated chloride channel family protein